MRVICLIVLLSVNCQAQNIYQFSKYGKNLKVTRSISTTQNALARKVILTNKVLNSQNLRATYIQPFVPPMQVVGGNNYLRGVSKQFSGRKGWEKINNVKGYNGAHHIVTKKTLKELGFEGDILSNAPSVFHPMHNNPYLVREFHNHERQVELYKQYGVKAIILDFFERINKLNKSFGLPVYEQAEIDKTLLEAELWAKHWGLKWE